jgi:hypothetical protein
VPDWPYFAFWTAVFIVAGVAFNTIVRLLARIIELLEGMQ